MWFTLCVLLVINSVGKTSRIGPSVIEAKTISKTLRHGLTNSAWQSWVWKTPKKAKFVKAYKTEYKMSNNRKNSEIDNHLQSNDLSFNTLKHKDNLFKPMLPREIQHIHKSNINRDAKHYSESGCNLSSKTSKAPRTNAVAYQKSTEMNSTKTRFYRKSDQFEIVSMNNSIDDITDFKSRDKDVGASYFKESNTAIQGTLVAEKKYEENMMDYKHRLIYFKTGPKNDETSNVNTTIANINTSPIISGRSASESKNKEVNLSPNQTDEFKNFSDNIAAENYVNNIKPSANSTMLLLDMFKKALNHMLDMILSKISRLLNSTTGKTISDHQLVDNTTIDEAKPNNISNKDFNMTTKLIVPKVEINNEDDIFNILSNQSSNNESIETASPTSYSGSTLWQLVDDCNDSANVKEKYKKFETILLGSGERRKLTKHYFFDDENPDWRVARKIFVNKKKSKRNDDDVAKDFINELNFMMTPITRKVRAFDMHKSTNAREKQVDGTTLRPTPVRYDNLLHSLLLMWAKNKSRIVRNSFFNKYRRYNKYQINLKPIMTNNERGQISLQMIRVVDPFENVMRRFNQYYDFSSSSSSPTNPSLATLGHNFTSKLRGKSLRDMTTGNMYLDDEEIDRFIDMYVGFKSILMGNVAKRKYNVKKRLIVLKPAMSLPAQSVSPLILFSDIANNSKTEQSKPFPNTTLYEIENNMGQAEVVEKHSTTLPKFHRFARDLRRVLDSKTKSPNLKMPERKIFHRYLKFYKRNAYLAPQIDQKTYAKYRVAQYLSKFNNVRIGKININTAYNKNKRITKTNMQNAQLYDAKPRKTGFIKKKARHNKRSNLNSYNKKSESNLSKPIDESLRTQSHDSVKKLRPPITTAKNFKKKTRPQLLKSHHNQANPRLRSLDEVKQHLTNFTKDIRKVSPNSSIRPKTKYKKNMKTANVSKLSHNVNATKNSKKRELEVFRSNTNRQYVRETANSEDTFNADFGLELNGQGSVLEQLEQSQEQYSDRNIDKPKHRYAHRIGIGSSFNFAHRDLASTGWANSGNRTAKDNMNINVSSKYKHKNYNEPLNNVSNAEKDESFDYMNLDTPRKSDADLDPRKFDENAITHFEKENAVKNIRAISPVHLYPQIDDYNDVFLRDNNIENNRMDADYINHNIIGTEILDNSEHGHIVHDKYAIMTSKDFSPALHESYSSKNLKEAHDILKGEHKWHKVQNHNHLSKFDKSKLSRYSKIGKGPSRLRANVEPNVDYINVKSERVNDKKINKTFKNDKLIRSSRKEMLKKQRPRSMNTIATTSKPMEPIVADEDELLKNMKVYIHKIIPYKTDLHSSKHFPSLWSRDQNFNAWNSVLFGVSPLDIWIHKAFHIGRPLPDQIEVPEEVEFDRRKRHSDQNKPDMGQHTLALNQLDLGQRSLNLGRHKEDLKRNKLKVDFDRRKRNLNRNEPVLNRPKLVLGLHKQNLTGPEIDFKRSKRGLNQHEPNLIRRKRDSEQHESTPSRNKLEVGRQKQDLSLHNFNQYKQHKRKWRLVCCLVKMAGQHELVKHVKDTWGRRCDVIVLITNKGRRSDTWEYTLAGLKFIHDLHYNDANWILKADIDSYIVVENLKYMVKDYDPDTPFYFGRPGLKDLSNFVLSTGGLQALIARRNDAETCQANAEAGESLGYCLEYLGIKVVDSRDKLGRERFYPFSPLNYEATDLPDGAGDEVFMPWSDYAVSFSKVNFKDMYCLDYFIYRIHPNAVPSDVLSKVKEIHVDLADLRLADFTATTPRDKKPANNHEKFKMFGQKRNVSNEVEHGGNGDNSLERQFKGIF